MNRMVRSASGISGRPAREILAAIERFLETCREPALLEPGEDLLPLRQDQYALQLRDSRITLQAWDQTRNLVRRITAVRDEKPGKLELATERFAHKRGVLLILDVARPAAKEWERRGARLVFRERFRQFLARQFTGWRIAELSSEPDLEHSLSPAYARAFLTRGQAGWAAMGAEPGSSDPAGALAFGLIWLDYLRRRERRTAVEGLSLFLPAGRERQTCLRLPFLNSEVARYEVFAYSEDGYAARLDPADFGNLDTSLDVARRIRPHPWVEKVARRPGVECVARGDGSASLRVRGVEFARATGDEFLFGLENPTPASEHHLDEIVALASGLARFRSPAAPDRRNPLYWRNPEAWLESQVRSQIERLDATLLPAPVYGQVPAMAGGDRGVIDLLACDRSGRLAVLELKASADLQLPFQALDYWMRVKWHAERDEFSARGYFTGISLRRDAPRLLLVSPALDFHPTTETLLRYFAPWIAVERIGVGVEWRSKLEVMFRLQGAQSPG